MGAGWSGPTAPTRRMRGFATLEPDGWIVAVC